MGRRIVNVELPADAARGRAVSSGLAGSSFGGSGVPGIDHRLVDGGATQSAA